MTKPTPPSERDVEVAEIITDVDKSMQECIISLNSARWTLSNVEKELQSERAKVAHKDANLQELRRLADGLVYALERITKRWVFPHDSGIYVNDDSSAIAKEALTEWREGGTGKVE